jgi:hypothetical protein
VHKANGKKGNKESSLLGFVGGIVGGRVLVSKFHLQNIDGENEDTE